MSRITGYFDCFAGIAGDMILGAMCDAGLPLAHLERALRRLDVRGYRLWRRVERRGALGGVHLVVDVAHAPHHHHDWHAHHHYPEIHRLIGRSRLPKPVRQLAQAIFHRLALAEAKAHRVPVRRVHFHEVGAVDSIVDIVGAAIGFHYFDFAAVYSSPLPISRGFVRSAHGRLPVPPPATMELLTGVPLVTAPVRAELVTPTGAAILTVVAAGFGECPLRVVERVGYGLGDRHFRQVPNALRLMIGEGAPVVAIEANIDDSSPQLYEYLIEELLRAGALDVTVRPVLMKKRRPAVQVQALCEEAARAAVTRSLLRETTSFGVRYYPVERCMLAREMRPVRTKYGVVRVKIGSTGPRAGEGEVVQSAPEYEDCKHLARKCNVPLREIYRVALAAIQR